MSCNRSPSLSLHLLVLGFMVQMLKAFLLWLKNDVGPWGPVIM